VAVHPQPATPSANCCRPAEAQHPTAAYDLHFQEHFLQRKHDLLNRGFPTVKYLGKREQIPATTSFEVVTLASCNEYLSLQKKKKKGATSSNDNNLRQLAIAQT